VRRHSSDKLNVMSTNKKQAPFNHIKEIYVLADSNAVFYVLTDFSCKKNMFCALENTF
jgi:hypothetical protein